MTVLSRQSIIAELGEDYIRPWVPEKRLLFGMSYGLTGAGYDLRIAQDVTLEPLDFALASSVEWLAFPNSIVGGLKDKSTWARKGLQVFNTVFEPGWYGYPTLELFNNSSVEIEIFAGMPIAQMQFSWLDQPTDRPYNGKYQDQSARPQAAVYEQESLDFGEGFGDEGC
jgi:dCTP deaminase